MVCRVIQTEHGSAIVCGPKARQKRCACGAPATLLCDWKVVRNAKKGTCDVPICEACTHKPAPDKDLCPAHAAEWAERQERADGRV